MDISKLQGAQSFSTQKLDKPLSAEERKALEGNGKVDLVIQDGDETVLLSGENINLNEYNQKMGEAIPNWGMGPYFNEDLRPLQNMDANDDGILTESETRWGAGEAASDGLDRMGDTITGGATIGAMKGMGYGYSLGSPALAKVGYALGGLFGGAVGLVSSPFTGGAKAIETYGERKTISTWTINNDVLRDVR